MMPASGEDTLQTTGCLVDTIVLALIEAAFDKNENVGHAVCNSLCALGKHQPNLVLSSCHSYLQQHPKIPLGYKVLILGVMERVCNDSLDRINKIVVLDLIKLAVEEMVNAKEVVPEWQNAASGILVCLGRRFQNEVMEFLLMKFQPGVLPHFFVVQTLANLASANVFGMVPFLKALLGTMLPLLGMVKQENMKWIFAYALARFSESVLEYLANIEKAPDPTVKKEVFTSEIGSAYDVLFNSWLQSREIKVRAEVVEALGHMTHLLSKEKLEEQLPKVIPGILLLYKRQQESYHTTQGLCMILDVSVSNQSAALELQLDNILNALFPQVCSLPDYSQPSSVKNHNEVLRCFAVLAQAYCDRLVAYLLQRLENSNERVRIGALTILKHLINSCDAHLNEKATLILSGLRPSLSDTSNKVKKILAQVAVALAHHGYLELEGGQAVVWFIVRQCALPNDHHIRRPTDTDFVSNEALRGMCENVLHLLTTTVEKMEKVLWPDLLECLMPEDLTTAVSPICKSLAYLAGKKREELGPDFDIDYANQTHIPKPHAILSRLLVLLGHPTKGRNRGISILHVMKAVVPLIDKNLMALWDASIPQFIQQLEADDCLNAWTQQWQEWWNEQLVKFVTQTLTEIDREEWTVQLGKTMLLHLPLYNSNPEDKFILLKLFGVVMKKIGNKSFITQALDTIFENVNHSNPIEREGCAVAVGYCGSTHLDVVLVKLEQVVRGDRRNSGILGFLKEFKGDTEHEKLKATIILSYGHVALHAPSSILTTRVETPILRSIAIFYQSSRDLCVKQSMLISVKLIAEALHPEHLKETFNFRSRNELLNQMKSILKSEMSVPLASPVRSLALSAISSLVALDPVLDTEEKSSLIQTAVSAVYPLPKDCIVHKPWEDTIDSYLDFDQLLSSAMDSLKKFLKQLVVKERTPVNVESILQTLHPWLTSKHEVERERCIVSVLFLLQAYLEGAELMSYTPFTRLGVILGMLIPRSTDPQVAVRLAALDGVRTLLQISLSCQSDSDAYNNETFENLKHQIINDDPSSLFSATNDLTKMISEKLPSDQLGPFMKSLIEGLCDPHPQSSSGASVVLNGIVRLRSREMRQEIPEILHILRNRLAVIICPQTRIGALRCILNFASHHMNAVVSSLLSTSLPLDNHVIDSWKMLAQDSELGRSILEHLLEIITDSTLSEDHPESHNRKASQTAVLRPLLAVCALGEMFRVAEMEQCAKNFFEQIFTTLLLAAGMYVGTVLPSTPLENGKKDTLFSISKSNVDNKMLRPSPVKCATESLKTFLLCAKQDAVVTTMIEEGYWQLMQNEGKYPEAVAALASSLCIHCANYIPKIVAILNPMLNSHYEAQRIVTVALFAELLTHKYETKHSLTEPLMSTLLGRLADPSHTVRRLCIRGLGSIGSLDSDQVQRYSTTVLTAMMAGMDDKDDPGSDITLEAMSGLSSILTQVAEQDIRQVLVNITLRIRPMFDKERAPVRAAAFTLFGNLCHFGDGPSKEPLVEQIHYNLVTILLHLNDDDKVVVKSCKYALRLLGPLLDSENINNMFQKHLLDEAQLHYGEFINDLTKTVIADFPDKISAHVTSAMSYLKSSVPTIQCNASILLGFLLGNLSPDQHHVISKEKACLALILLLKDQSPEVRVRAAEALSFLHRY